MNENYVSSFIFQDRYVGPLIGFLRSITTSFSLGNLSLAWFMTIAGICVNKSTCLVVVSTIRTMRSTFITKVGA
jgi:hypothetical protein